MNGSFGMNFNIAYTEEELDFIKIRDKIVHTGKFPKNKSPLEEYHNVINFIDRIILKILGYTGEYLNIKNHYKTWKTKGASEASPKKTGRASIR